MKKYDRQADIIQINKHHIPICISDWFALGITKFMRYWADIFFAHRYDHRAVVLETIAALPGMIGGTHQHLCSLRRMISDRGWINTLLDEAENERMHLMTFINVTRITLFERMLVRIVQVVFYSAFFVFYFLFPKTAHRIIGYFEEEAVYSYTEYLAGVENGVFSNVPAPQIAIEYWHLPPNARLRDVIIEVRADEAGHRDVNHGFADELA